MVSYIFEFTYNETRVRMYRDDDGMYRVVERTLTGDGARQEFLLGVLYEKAMAIHVFDHAVQSIYEVEGR